MRCVVRECEQRLISRTPRPKHEVNERPGQVVMSVARRKLNRALGVERLDEVANAFACEVAERAQLVSSSCLLLSPNEREHPGEAVRVLLALDLSGAHVIELSCDQLGAGMLLCGFKVEVGAGAAVQGIEGV